MGTHVFCRSRSMLDLDLLLICRRIQPLNDIPNCDRTQGLKEGGGVTALRVLELLPGFWTKL